MREQNAAHNGALVCVAGLHRWAGQDSHGYHPWGHYDQQDHTLAKSLRELEALGFIARTRNTVGVEHGSRVCNLYRFTDMDAYDFPKLGVSGAVATRDYLRFESATAAQKAAEEARKPNAKKKTTLQKVQRHAAESAASEKGQKSRNPHEH